MGGAVCRVNGQWMNGFEDWLYYQLMDGHHRWFTVGSSTVHSLHVSVCVFLSVFGSSTVHSLHVSVCVFLSVLATCRAGVHMSRMAV